MKFSGLLSDHGLTWKLVCKQSNEMLMSYVTIQDKPSVLSCNLMFSTFLKYLKSPENKLKICDAF